jgi:hypothetical protein
MWPVRTGVASGRARPPSGRRGRAVQHGRLSVRGWPGRGRYHSARRERGASPWPRRTWATWAAARRSPRRSTPCMAGSTSACSLRRWGRSSPGCPSGRRRCARSRSRSSGCPPSSRPSSAAAGAAAQLVPLIALVALLARDCIARHAAMMSATGDPQGANAALATLRQLGLPPD